MSPMSSEQLGQRVIDLGLVQASQLEDVWREFGSREVPGDQFCQALVRRGLLTNYQVDKLLKGDTTGYFFGDYCVMYLVGAGSFARVYRAKHRHSGEVVALKVLRHRFSNNPEAAAQFVREGRLGMALRHPNIVAVYDVISEGRTHFMVMEFVEGQNLREFVKVRGRLDTVVATRIALDIASGLDYAMRQGMTHRDMKLSNVLIASDGTAKLVDFGLAAVDEAVEANLPEVPPNARAIDYAALEKATGAPKGDPRSDIYFLGCMYYHMLTGEAPLLETKDRIKRMNKARLLDVVPISQRMPDLPKPLCMIVEKAMELDPSRRYQTAGEMALDLKTAAQRLIDGTINQVEKLNDVKEELQQQQVVLVVESNVKLQDLLRKSLKKVGYRVLVMADPERAVNRLLDDPDMIDCVVFNAQELGQAAIDAFNKLGDDPRTHLVPAVLMLDDHQRGYAVAANTSDHRRILQMPIKVRDLRNTVAELVAIKAPSQ